MRFKKGDKVEVLDQKEMPSGAWRCAVIVSGNGHNYSVRYDWSFNLKGQAVVERVPRKAIRPCPPPVQFADSWAVGDVAEVFDDGFWKMAMVLEVCFENYYLTRLLGSSEEFRIHKSRIRMRQFLKDGKWIVIGKGPGSDFHNRTSSLVPRLNLRIRLPAGNDCLPPLDNSSYQDSHTPSSTSLKRTLPYTEAYPRKMRTIEKECGRQQVISRSPSFWVRKVDAVACLKEMKGTLSGANSLCERSSEVSDCDSDACSIESVGSCSVNGNSSNKLSAYNLAGNSEDADTLSSDADSFSSGADEPDTFSVPLKQDVAATIHRLELHAYRRTLMAMHASGSLSWEKEDLLTTLRMSLHISNDEHLMEGQGWRLACLASKGLKMVLGNGVCESRGRDFTGLAVCNHLIKANILPPPSLPLNPPSRESWVKYLLENGEVLKR